MNNLNKFDPFRNFEKTLTSLFGVAPQGYEPSGVRVTREANPQADSHSFAWTPQTDVVETDKAFLLELELPRVKKEDIKVAVHDGILTLTGKRESRSDIEKYRYHRQERLFGTFRRQFVLPEGVDESQITAEFKEGVLELKIPKIAELQPKSFEIKVN
jgi:HSP20 family protein